GVLLSPACCWGQGAYVEYSTFREWIRSIPEAKALGVCSLTETAHRLWMQQKMRVPETMFMRGNFSGTGRTDWVVQLYEPASESAACDYVLIVSRSKGFWERFFFGKIHLNQVGGLLWYSKRRALAIDIGERRRRSAPAQMFWSDGSESFQAGWKTL
ncbi:MAG: hypothetical protein ACREU7_04745, partial [Burkholderiales bacterium]